MHAYRLFITITITITLLLLLNNIRHSSAQIVGCDGPNVQCPTKKNESDSLPCNYNNGEIGVVSLNSNVTTEPLTWTVTMYDDGDKNFWLGSPPSLDLARETDFGACALRVWNMTTALQLPAGFSDFANFGCPTVLGDDCVQDLIIQMREQLVPIVNGSTELVMGGSPCDTISHNFEENPPASCRDRFGGRPYGLLAGNNITRNARDLYVYTPQDSCSLTTGGRSYLMTDAAGAGNENDFEYQRSENEELFKTGTTPIFTLFYNEPWNNASTGPVAALADPEVHLSCLTAVTSVEQESGASRIQDSVSALSGITVLSGLLWTLLAI